MEIVGKLVKTGRGRLLYTMLMCSHIYIPFSVLSVNFVSEVSATQSIGYCSVSSTSIIYSRLRAVMRGLTGAVLNVVMRRNYDSSNAVSITRDCWLLVSRL